MIDCRVNQSIPSFTPRAYRTKARTRLDPGQFAPRRARPTALLQSLADLSGSGSPSSVFAQFPNLTRVEYVAVDDHQSAGLAEDLLLDPIGLMPGPGATERLTVTLWAASAIPGGTRGPADRRSDSRI